MSPLLLMLIACAGGGGTVEDTMDDTAGTPSPDGGAVTDTAEPTTFTTCDGQVARVTCPEDALDLSGTDRREVRTVDLDWTWSAECFQSVAPAVYLKVPDDATSLTITVDAGTEATELDRARDGHAPGGPKTEDDYWTYATAAVTRTWPETPEDPSVDGCWAVFPRAESTQPEALDGRLLIVVRRGEPVSPTLRVVAVLVDEPRLGVSDAESVMAEVSALYAAGGLQLEVAPTETMTFQPGEPVGLWDDRLQMLAAWKDENGTGAIPVFFVPEYNASGTIGMAGGIPGSPHPGTASNGVTVAVDPLWDFSADAPELDQMSQVVAHEFGHQIGLWHTTESDGESFDPMPDTPECTTAFDTDDDGKLDNGECAKAGADNVMFWASMSSGQDVLSADQLWAMTIAAAVDPG